MEISVRGYWGLGKGTVKETRSRWKHKHYQLSCGEDMASTPWYKKKKKIMFTGKLVKGSWGLRVSFLTSHRVFCQSWLRMPS